MGPHSDDFFLERFDKLLPRAPLLDAPRPHSLPAEVLAIVGCFRRRGRGDFPRYDFRRFQRTLPPLIAAFGRHDVGRGPCLFDRCDTILGDAAEAGGD